MVLGEAVRSTIPAHPGEGREPGPHARSGESLGPGFRRDERGEGRVPGGIVAIGVGFRKACTAATLAALVREALDRTFADIPDRDPGPTHPGGQARFPPAPARLVLATIAEKDRPALREAAAILGLAVVVLPKAALGATGDRITVESALAKACLGVPSVAEAAALAAAGPGSRLLLARIATADATCAVAHGDGS